MQLINEQSNNAGIYLHIPFCRQACIYCNFHFSTSLKYKDELLAAMVDEIAMQKGYLEGKNITTIYLGGGTPSLLTADEINVLTETVYKNFNITTLAEFTLEANPDDLTKNYLNSLKQTQVNRLSIGTQSFIERDLRYMKRIHTAQEADYAIKAAQDTGLANISIDLIYGTPGLTNAEWKGNISKVAELGIPHFSAYALTVEEKTALQHAITNKKSAPVSPAQAATQFELLMDYAGEKGYDHYEISNLAVPGMHAVHNTNYWRGNHYLGIGPSAHSFNGVSRKWNVANNALYTQSINTDKKIPSEQETLTVTQQLNEYVMTSLRTMWGCDLSYVRSKWGNDYASELLKNATESRERNRIILDGEVLKLTNKGKLYADSIASDLFF